MAPIRLASAMLGRVDGDEPLLPRVQSLVTEQLAHISRLVGDLVESGGAGGAGLQIERRAVNLKAIVEAAIATCRPALSARGQRLEAELVASPVEVLGDAERLAQVVSNLLDNASKHSHDGGRIGLGLSLDGATVRLSISDDGIGITPQMLPHVFDPFVQDPQALGLNGVGLGIGLTVVRALVEAHGGSLVAQSQGSGCGSQFVVELPAAGAAPGEAVTQRILPV